MPALRTCTSITQTVPKNTAMMSILFSGIFPYSEIHPAAHISASGLLKLRAGKEIWEMHDMIFEHQQNLNGHTLLNFAERLSMDIQQFTTDWKSEAIMEEVEKDFESGIRSGVNGTPSFFINGEKLMSYDGSYESLVEAINIFEHSY